MDKNNLHNNDKFFIEQAITGGGSAEQFNEVMDRAEVEPEFRKLFEQTVAEHNWMEHQVDDAEHVIVQGNEIDMKLLQLEEMNRETQLTNDREEEFERLLEQDREQEMDR